MECDRSLPWLWLLFCEAQGGRPSCFYHRLSEHKNLTLSLSSGSLNGPPLAKVKSTPFPSLSGPTPSVPALSLGRFSHPTLWAG